MSGKGCDEATWSLLRMRLAQLGLLQIALPDIASPPGSREFRNGGNYVLTDRHSALPNRQTLFGKCLLSRIESWVD